MPPRSQRSRACSQCRTRRVKCDETPETCNQCRRLGLNCSGPVVGTIVIDMTDRVVKPRGRKKKEDTKAASSTREDNDPQSFAVRDPPRAVSEGANHLPAPDVTNPDGISRIQRRPTEEVEKAITAIRHHQKLPTFQQPSIALPEALDTAFLAHFIQTINATKTYSPEVQWLAHLPRIHSNVQKPSVKFSLRAVSMACYGKHRHNPSILVDSWRWYTLSLSSQRMSISQVPKNDIPGEEEVLVPLILAMYEMLVGSTTTGGLSHLGAASDVLNMRGPSNSKTDAMWPLFTSIRSSEAHRAVIFNQPSPFSSPDWMTIPFFDMPPDPDQSLTAIELMIPHCVALLQIPGNLRVVLETPIPRHTETEACLKMIEELIADLDAWAEKHHNMAEVATIPPKPSEPNILHAPGDTNNRGESDSFVPLIRSNYLATRVTLNVLAHKIRTESPLRSEASESLSSQYLEGAIAAANAIMKAIVEIEQALSPSFDLLRGLAPLITVACAGPTAELRNSAREMMERWGSKLGGLPSVVAVI